MNEGAGPKARQVRFRAPARRSAVCVGVAVLSLFFAARPAGAQATPSFSAAAAYNMLPGTVPIGVATGVFNTSGGDLLDFAVLEQVPNSGLYQVEIFHGKSDGTFYTNLGNANPNPDVIPLGSSVKGNAIAVGQFRASGPLDVAVATNTGIVFLQNNDTGTFTLSSTAISSANGFATLAVGLFNGDGNPDIAAGTPTVSGSVSFTVFFGDGTGAFPTRSSSYAVSNMWAQCAQIMPGNFQSQTTGSDLALLCNNPSEAGVLVYLNTGSGGGYTYTYSSTPYSAGAFGGVLPSAAVGTLNGLATIFVSSASNSFATYQSNGAGAFTAVSMIPVGLAPHGPLAILYNTPRGAIDFASGASVSTFTSYAQSGTSVNGTWNSTASLGPSGTLATGSSNLTQGTTYVVVDAGTHSSDFANPNVSGPPNFEPYVDERSIGVYLVTLAGDGTVASTNIAPVYAGTGLNGYAAPPVFATGDFNGDGVMDLAVGGANDATGDATLTIYLANSDGSLPVPPTTTLPVVTANNTDYSGTDAVVAGKFRPPQSGKTLYDLAVFSLGQIAIFTSNGDGSFSTGNSYSLSGDPNYPGFTYNPSGGHPFAPVLTAADVNGDGFDDIVLTLPEDNCKGSGSVSQGAVYILLSNGDGTFQSPVFVAPPVENPVSATAAKFLGSSLPDLVFANGGELCSGNTATTTANAVGILQNQVTLGATSISAANFTASAISISTQSTDPGVPNVTAVASGDFNGDGHPDLVVSSTNGIQVLLNSGTGAFSPTAQGVVPLYAGDVVPGPLCSNANNYVGCVTYDSQVATGSFFASGETDVAAAVNGVVYIFQNNSGTLAPPTQSFVAGPSSGMISAALAGSNGLNGVLVATSQGTAYLSNSGSGSTSGPSVATYSTGGPIDFVTNVNSTATQQLVLTNTGGTAFTISGISTSGIDPAFSVSNVVCNGATDFPFSNPVNLGPGLSCMITLQFAPTAFGNGQADLLTILDTASSSNASAAPQNNGQSFLLTGDATEPFATFSPTALSFGSVNDGTAVTQTVTVTNTGNGPLTLQLALIGPLGGGFSYTQAVCNSVVEPSPTPFPITLSPGSPGGSCTFTVQFDPTVAGPLSGTLGFADNAGVGESNLPSTSINGTSFQQIVSLSGTGVSVGPPPPVTVTDNETITVTDSDMVNAFTLSPPINVAAPVAYFSDGSPLGFGGQNGSQQTLAISNIGQVSMALDSVAISSGSPFTMSAIACFNGATSSSGTAATLPSGGFCSLTITYTGSSPSTDTGTLTFTDNAALSNLTSTTLGSNFTQSIALNGEGSSTAPPPPPPATVNVPTSGPDSEPITVTDSDVVNAFTLSPPINVAAPVAYFSDSSPLGFGGQNGSQQTLAISNIGQVSMALDSVAISSGSPFTMSAIACFNGATSGSGTAATLPSGGFCSLTITYTGSSPSTDTGTLTFTDNAALSNLTSTTLGSNFTQSIALNGEGSSTAPPPPPPATITIPTVNEMITVIDQVTVTPLINVTAPVVFFSTSSLGFGNVAAGQTGTQIITVSNIGEGQTGLTLSSAVIAVSGPQFTLGPIDCSNGASSFPTTLPSGGACLVSITYAAPLAGTANATLTFTDNTALSNLTSTPSGSNFTQTVSLLGSGTTAVAPPPPPATVQVSDNETITVTDSPQLQTAGCPTITVSPAGTLTLATIGVAFMQQFSASSGVTPLTWATSGAPSGLNINSSSGLLSGTPTATGTFPFTVTATDHNNCPGSASVSLTVAPKPSTTATTITSTSSSYKGFALPTNFALVGNPVVVNFTVQPTLGSATPTGTVKVTDGVSANDGCSVTLSAGAGSCPVTISTTSAASAPLTATYTPDANSSGLGLLTSTSTSVTENLVEIESCGAAPSGLSVSQGTTANFTVSICVSGSVQAAAAAVVTGCPPSAQCSDTVTPVPNESGVYTVVVTILTGAAGRSVPIQDRRPRGEHWPLPLFGFGMLLAMLMALQVARQNRPRLLYAAGFAIALVLLSGINGCASGGGSSANNTGTPPNTYTVNVTVTAGNFSVNVPLNLTVTR